MPVLPVDTVPKEVQLKSRECSMIINKNTGREFPRNLEPTARWGQLFYECSKPSNKDIFDFVWDTKKDTTIEVEGDKGMEKRAIFGKAELEGLSMPRLREIGKMYDIKDISKSSIIVKILDQQAALYKKASLESLPKE